MLPFHEKMPLFYSHTRVIRNRSVANFFPMIAKDEHQKLRLNKKVEFLANISLGFVQLYFLKFCVKSLYQVVKKLKYHSMFFSHFCHSRLSAQRQSNNQLRQPTQPQLSTASRTTCRRRRSRLRRRLGLLHRRRPPQLPSALRPPPLPQLGTRPLLPAPPRPLATRLRLESTERRSR